MVSVGMGLMSLAVGGCAPSRTILPTSTTAIEGLFYPPAPEPPRVQHLATYASETDVVPRNRSFRDFIVGEAGPPIHLIQPYGAALFQGCLYVVDTAAAGMAMFDIARSRFTTVTGSAGGRMSKPINVTIDDDGTKYICDTGRNQILVYDEQHHFQRALGGARLFKPTDCVIQGQHLFVTDVAQHRVHKLDKMTGEVKGAFGKPGSDIGELFHPTNIAAGPDGDLYVVETSNFRVQRFSASGEPVRTYGHIGDGPGSFARPKGIAIDREGRLFVGDAAFGNVQIFTNDGRLLLAFGQSKIPGQSLHLPASVSIDYDNVALFQELAATGFNLEFLILVVSQFGPNKVDVFGYGRMAGVNYPKNDVIVDSKVT